MRKGINHTDKPKLTAAQLVAKMRDEKGIRFNIMDEGAAGPYLTSIDCPIWALTEVITFGDFARLYNFYYDRCGRTDRKLDGGIVNPVRTLRNACGHNSCMLFDLKEHTGKTHPGHAVTQFVAGVPGIGQRERRKKLSCRPLFEICCLLYAEQHYVTDEVRKNQMEKLKTFVDDRLFRHPEAFQESQIISTAFDFLRKMVDGCC